VVIDCSAHLRSLFTSVRDQYALSHAAISTACIKAVLAYAKAVYQAVHDVDKANAQQHEFVCQVSLEVWQHLVELSQPRGEAILANVFWQCSTSHVAQHQSLFCQIVACMPEVVFAQVPVCA
jgi:hypothetical protein